MRVAVHTEDEKFYNRMETLSAQLEEGSGISFSLYRVSRQQQLAEILASSALQLAFVDLEMSGGQSVAEYLHLNNPDCAIYLLDGSKENSLFGYQVGARDFLIKPLKEEMLKEIISRETKARWQNRKREIQVKINGQWKAISVNRILYVESIGHNLVFHMVNGKDIRFVASFKEYHPILSLFPGFLRCHQSYLLNLDYVIDMKSESFFLANGEEINISRQYRKECKKYYTDFLIRKYYS